MSKFNDIILDDTNVDTSQVNNNDSDDTTNISGGHDDIVDINDKNNDNVNTNNDNNNNNDTNDNHDNDNNNVNDSGLEEGQEVELEDGTIYTMKDGNLVDKDGKIFKEGKDIKAFLDNFANSDDTPTEFNLASLQQALGVDVKDDKGNAVEFTDDEAGRASYVREVMELTRREAETIALNTFFQNNPIVKSFVDYLTVNNGSYQGFGEMPDRTGIEFNPDNAEQHKAIVRVAWAEFGKRGDVEKYIKYLEDSGALADTAKEDLAAIQEQDKAYKENLTKQAEQARKEQEAELNAYWNDVYKAIDSKVIGGYRIPDAFTVERNGQKINLTPKDFFDYVNKTDKQTGLTAYQRDLANMTQEQQISRELLDAWRMFTGSDYDALVAMKVKENEAKRLKLVAKQAKTSGTIKIHKPSGNKVNLSDILLS